MTILKKNRFWFIKGLETLSLGLIFLGTAHYIDQPPRAPLFITYVDDPIFAISLVIIGTYSMLICTSLNVNKRLKSIMIFSLLFIWTFYFVIFLIHDFMAPTFFPHFDTLITFYIVISTWLEVFWGDSI